MSVIASRRTATNQRTNVDGPRKPPPQLESFISALEISTFRPLLLIRESGNWYIVLNHGYYDDWPRVSVGGCEISKTEIYAAIPNI